MLVVKHSPEALFGPLPLPLLLTSSFLLLRLAGVRLLLSQDQMGQGLDSLGTSCAYKANTTEA